MEGIIIIPEGKNHSDDMPTHYRVVSGDKQISISSLELDHAQPTVTEDLKEEIRQYLREFMMPVPVINFQKLI